MKRNSYLHQYASDFAIIIFHERMPGWHRDLICRAFRNTQITWIDVCNLFQNDVPGYNCMCHFHAIDCWQYLKDFDIAVRIDEDVYIKSDITYEYDKCYSDGLSIGFHNTQKDYHRKTFDTFPQFFQQYAFDNYGKIVNGHKPRTHYCSHFCTYNVKWWLQDKVQEYLMACSNGIKKYRWGDYVIQSGAIDLFNGKVQRFNTQYHHLSPQ